jgi:putative ABC transport system permease protein
VSYTVSQRAAEIGLRMAIGATGGDVQRMILRQAAGLGVAGAGAGLALALTARLLLSRTVRDFPLPPAVAVLTAAALMGVALAAAWLPARRAARIAPTLALRGD